MYTYLLLIVFLLITNTEGSVIQRGPSRRPDLPQRTGQGFFINNKYVSDEHLWGIFGEHASIASPRPTLTTEQKHHKNIHKKYHTNEFLEQLPKCCSDFTAQCQSCKIGKSLHDFCAENAFVPGCQSENVVLHENEVCYEYCPQGTQINYPDKCAFGLICAPFSKELYEGGGCGLQAYTCQHEFKFEPKAIQRHEDNIADHMMTQFVLGDDWFDEEMKVMMEDMSICEKIDYKVKTDPTKCDLQHKYLYKSKGCCEKDRENESPLLYILLGAGICCCFMTCAAIGGCAEMQRRKADRLERRMRRLIDVDKDVNIMQSFWDKKNHEYNLEFRRKQRYSELHAELFKEPLLYNEIL